jgi:fibronectin-binding autotransporter adhesin
VGDGTGSSGVASLSGGSLTTSATYVGYGGGVGTFLQGGGSSNLAIGGASYLLIGDLPGSSGTVSMSGGSLTADSTYVGLNEGVGIFLQSAGSSDLGGGVVIGLGAGSPGTILLSGGSFVTGSTNVGVIAGDGGGSGTFLQSGTLSVSNLGTFVIGDGTGSTGTGSLTGGSLSAGVTYVGNVGGTGYFLQNAGSSSLGAVLVTSTGTISLTGGTLTAQSLNNGGSITINSTAYITGGAALNGTPLSTGTTTVGGNGGTGTLMQSGSLSVSNLGWLTVGGGTASTGTVSLVGGSLSAAPEVVGYNDGRDGGGAGTFVQSGSSTSLISFLGFGDGTGSTGTGSLSGGSLTAVSTYVGYSGGAGTFLQSAGSSNLASSIGDQFFYIGEGTGSTGVVSVSGGTLLANKPYVGIFGGSGTFLQSGSLTVSNLVNGLLVGFAGGLGTVSLSGGTMTTDDTSVGYYGSGTFLQSGSLSVSNLGTLLISYGTGATGTVSLTGGSLTAPSTDVGFAGSSGTFLQGGSQSFSSLGTVTVGSTGTIALSGGTMNVQRINSSGAVIVSGGTLAITSAGTLGTGSLTSLKISGSGVVDIGSSALVIPYTGTSPIGELTPNGHTQTYPANSIQGYIQSAYDGGLWDNPGLTSSAAENDLIGLTAVGALDQNDLLNAEGSDYTGGTWMGVSITSDNTVLVRYTYYGDTDLDGTVGPADVNNLELGFSGVGDGWLYGDFNYDGMVDYQDVNLLDLGYGEAPLGDVIPLTAAQSKWLLATEKGLTPTQVAAFEARVGVPEPAALALLGVGAMGLLGRRRS